MGPNPRHAGYSTLPLPSKGRGEDLTHVLPCEGRGEDLTHVLPYEGRGEEEI
jgi:hypothetical protein